MAELDNMDPNEFSDLNNPDDGRSDPDKRFPRKEYVGVSGVNNIARGTRVANVYIGGSVPGIDLELNDEPSTQYPENQVKETSSGHIIEYDDTNGRERVMIRHRTGSGVEMRADGTVIYSSTNNALRIVAANEKVIVEGDGEVVYNGNLKMRVAGDFDLEVGGDFNVNVIGDKEENVRGSVLESISKNKTSTIMENKAETVLGVDTQTVLGDKNELVKGNYEANVEGTIEIDAAGTLTMSTENKFIATSPDVNISARSLSLAGDSGLIGGDGIVIEGTAANITRLNSTSMHATTFHGDLNGTAKEAIDANKAATAAAGPASPGGYSTTVNTATDKVLSRPNTAILNSIISDPVYGVRQVEIDTFDDLKYTVDKSRNYGGITKTEIKTTAEARSKLRDGKTLSNEIFVGEVISEGLVSKNFANTIPPQFGKSVSIKDKSQRGSEPMGPSNPKSKVYQT